MNQFDLSQIDADAFFQDLKALRREIDENLGEEDIVHLKKMERWGRSLTAIGTLTAGLIPNPVSMIALSLGRSHRLVMMHHINHRGYDRVPNIPAKYTSKVFAQGRRRFIDWVDWLTPESWAYEHNVLHHVHTAEDKDPDLIERNTETLREMKLPKALRYMVLANFSLLWRPLAYGPMALNMLKNRDKEWDENSGKYDVIPMLKAFFDWDYWKSGFIPYSLIHFVAFPLLFLPFGLWSATSALINSLGAEIINNVHGYFVVLPNHSGDDLYRYEQGPESRAERKIRQIVSSANYTTGKDWLDFPQLWLNYQIEHHIWPDIPILKYRQVQPKVKALCEKHGVPYIQESLFKRIKRMLKVVVGDTAMKRVKTLEPETAEAKRAI